MNKWQFDKSRLAKVTNDSCVRVRFRNGEEKLDGVAFLNWLDEDDVKKIDTIIETQELVTMCWPKTNVLEARAIKKFIAKSKKNDWTREAVTILERGGKHMAMNLRLISTCVIINMKEIFSCTMRNVFEIKIFLCEIENLFTSLLKYENTKN